MVEMVHFEIKNSAQKILSVNLKNLLIGKWHIKKISDALHV